MKLMHNYFPSISDRMFIYICLQVFYQNNLSVLFLYIVLTCICDVIQSTKKSALLARFFIFDKYPHYVYLKSMLYFKCLFNKKGGDDMLEVYHTLNLGASLPPILQGIVIHVVAYILIDIYKNRK